MGSRRRLRGGGSGGRIIEAIVRRAKRNCAWVEDASQTLSMVFPIMAMSMLSSSTAVVSEKRKL